MTISRELLDELVKGGELTAHFGYEDGRGAPPGLLNRRERLRGQDSAHLRTLLQQGEPTPGAWMVGRDGEPLTDPVQRSDGFPLPIGGPKGFGLTVATGLMAGVLNGVSFGYDVVDGTSNTISPINTKQFVVAINPAAFGISVDFGVAASRVFDEMRGSAPLPGHNPARPSGDGKTVAAQAPRVVDLKLRPAFKRDLDWLAEDCALPWPIPA